MSPLLATIVTETGHSVTPFASLQDLNFPSFQKFNWRRRVPIQIAPSGPLATQVAVLPGQSALVETVVHPFSSWRTSNPFSVTAQIRPAASSHTDRTSSGGNP